MLFNSWSFALFMPLVWVLWLVGGRRWRKTVLLPFNRVQHAEVSSGPLQRKFGLASLKFFTAGGSSVDLKIDGLMKERAEEIRSFIMEKCGNPHTR